jgi:hypothetical protein
VISNTEIANSINDLDQLYNSNSEQAIYFSKLALLEFCGWLEMSMDCIISDCSKTKLTEQTNKDHIEKAVVGKTYGFHYNQHFRPMLMKMVGLIKLEQIESPLIASGELSILDSQLGSLYQTRKRAAHTHINGATVTYEAPSKIKQYLTTLYPILQKYEAALQAI